MIVTAKENPLLVREIANCDVKCFVANELKYQTDNAQEKQLTWSLSKTLPTKLPSENLTQMSVSFEQYRQELCKFRCSQYTAGQNI